MDEFTIHIPRERHFSAVADLVVGGIAARHEVTLDVLDDLQLALDSLLEHDETDERELEIVLRVADGTIEASVGPLAQTTAAALDEREGGGRRSRAAPPARDDDGQRHAERARRRRLGRAPQGLRARRDRDR